MTRDAHDKSNGFSYQRRYAAFYLLNNLDVKKLLRKEISKEKSMKILQ
jgi:hypothetical protein